MLFYVLSFPEIVNKALEDADREQGGLEALLLPPAWGDFSQISDLGRDVRSLAAEIRDDDTEGPSALEAALAILGAFFIERAPVAFRMLPDNSALQIRALASTDQYGLVLDIGLERVMLFVLERGDLIGVADDMCATHEGARPLMVQTGVDDAIPVRFDSGEDLVGGLSLRP